MNVYELNRAQINELKAKLFNGIKEDDILDTIANVTCPEDISDMEIYDTFQDEEYTEQSFLCSSETVSETHLRDILSEILTAKEVKNLARFGRGAYASTMRKMYDDDNPSLVKFTIDVFVSYILDDHNYFDSERENREAVSRAIGRHLCKSEFQRMREYVQEHAESLKSSALQVLADYFKETA